MLSGFSASSSVILHFFFTKNPVKRGFRSYIYSFIRKSRDYLTWWHICKTFFFDCVKYFLPFFSTQFIHWAGVISICSSIFECSMYFAKADPSVVRAFCNIQHFAGLAKSGSIIDCFVNKRYCFTAI